MSETTFEINGQQMTAEQVVDSYKKLQADHTKVTQKNSEYSKNEEYVKEWLDFDKHLTEIETKTGQKIRGQVGGMIDGLIKTVTNGGTPNQTQINQLDKAIDKADAKGDTETLERLKAVEAQLFEADLESTLAGIAKQASSDGIEFDDAEFRDFADKWLDDLGIGDEFDTKVLKKAYEAYEAKKIKEGKKKDIPPLGTSGGSSSPNKPADKKIGGLKGAFEASQKLFK